MSPSHCLRSSVLCLALALAACGGAAAPSTPSATRDAPTASAAAQGSAKPAASASAEAIAPAKPGQIVAAYSEITAANAGLWGAKEGGIFQKRGLDVDPRLIESSLAIGAVISGQAPIASAGGSEALAAAVEGADLRIIGTVSPVYPYKFEVVASVQTKEDLKGKKVGVSRLGSSSDIATRAGLKKIGLDPDKDVTIVQVGSLQARTAAMLSGAIQGAVAAPPDTVTLEAQGFHPLFDLAALELPATNNCLVVNGAWLASHNDETQKYVDSLVESIVRLKKDKAFAFEVLKKYLKTEDPKLLDATYDYYVIRAVPALPYPRVEQFPDTVATVAEKNPKAKTFDLTKLIDASYVKSAADRGIDKI